MYKKTIWVILIAFGVSLITFSVDFAIKKAQERQPDVRLGYSRLIINLPIMIASDEGRGFFSDNELNVEFKPMSTTNAMQDAVVSGAVDAAAALGTEMFLQNNNLQRGILKAVAFNVLTENRFVDAIIVNADSPVSVLPELHQRRVGCYPATTVQTLLRLVGKNNFIDLLPVTVQPAQALETLSSNQVDALFVIEPQLTDALSKNRFRVIETAPFAKHVLNGMPVGVYVVNGMFNERHPKTVQRFARALSQAIEFIEADPDEARAIGERFLKAQQGQYKDTNLPEWALGGKVKSEEKLDLFASTLFTNEVLSAPEPHKDQILDLD